MDLQAQSERLLRDQLHQLQLEEQRDRLLLAERENELERLDNRLKDLNNKLESNRSVVNRINGQLTMQTNDIDSYISWSVTERAVQPPTCFPRVSSNDIQVVKKSFPISDETEIASAESARCKEVIAMYQERQAIRRHKMDTCVDRLGAAASVVGTIFQIAAFATTMAAYRVM
ncbi:uncharacterized protein LY89DRAFT_738265 [Mollisia scopiformis]|uniref:Uncharacterized protein n=1 Tax=Mollisia scopiformis TaxID=149040 RepID=A0A194WWX0_MOLSC|nr:uncharacterized protein LY89DRAFT_738265 [Mollisia scopiformis]KUJ12478.1 hypothetical protein LY89DRAFT_738265 [Mollisia scopiformis]